MIKAKEEHIMRVFMVKVLMKKFQLGGEEVARGWGMKKLKIFTSDHILLGIPNDRTLDTGN
jgi:hypothetical protein